MNKFTRKHINFRVFLVVALTTVAVIFCAYLFAFSRAAGITIGCILLSAMLAAVAITSVLFARGRIKLRYTLTAVLCFIIGVSAFTTATVTLDDREKGLSVGGYGYVTGRVCSVDVRTGDYRIDLEKLTVDGERVGGILRLSMIPSDNNIGDYAECGDIFSFGAYITAANIVDGYRINGTAYRSNIRYYAKVDPSKIHVEIGKPNLIERFTAAWHKLLVDNMGDRYGNIAFSMVTGDKHALDVDITSAFSAAGLGHIMAVSGLHIGFLTVLLNFILCKTDRRVRFGIIVAFLVAYCVIADFSPSVVRATVMAIISMAAVFLSGRKDLLSSLCCAFCLILAVKPLYLFETGFLMSFGSICGIALFSDGIARFFKKHGAPHRIASGISSSAAVQIGITPAMIYFFKSLQIFALIANIVLIPYIAAVFICIICFSMIGAIPFLGVTLKACEWLLIPLDAIAEGISAIPFSTVTVYSTAAVFLCYPVMFFASGFFMMPRGKIAVILASVAACVSFCLISAPMSDGTIYVPSGSYDTVMIDGGKVYVVADDCDYYEISQTLIRGRCKKIDELYMHELSEKNARAILRLHERFGIGAVYGDEFGLTAEYLIESGVNFVLNYGQADLVRIKSLRETVGFSYGDIAFARKNADAELFGDYSVIRINSIDRADAEKVYLTDRSEIISDGVYTSARGEYSYSIA